MNTAPGPMLTEVAPLTESEALVAEKWLGRVEGWESTAGDKSHLGCKGDTVSLAQRRLCGSVISYSGMPLVEGQEQSRPCAVSVGERLSIPWGKKSAQPDLNSAELLNFGHKWLPT